jgi:hypothetical protein
MAIVSANGAALPQSPNVIINGAFDIWQRGTSVTVVGAVSFLADRFRIAGYSGSGTTASRQTFSLNELNVSGFGEEEFYLRVNSTNQQLYFDHRVEDVRTLAGQVATLSFWARAASPLVLTSNMFQGFGSGGSADNVFTNKNNNITTSWQRFTHTFTVPSISGRTVGAGSFLSAYFGSSTLNTNLDVWGVQLEAGSIATPFRRNANSFQAELAACQRYYIQTPSSFPMPNGGIAYVSNGVSASVTFPSVMRIAPAVTITGFRDAVNGTTSTVTSLNAEVNTQGIAHFLGAFSAGSLTVGRAYSFGFTANAEL